MKSIFLPISDSCTMCKKYFERKSADAFTIYQDRQVQMFCSKICMNIYIITNRKIAPCQWCKVKKYNFDMIQKNSSQNQTVVFCSLNCLTLCEVSMNAIAMKQQPCDKCSTMTTPQYHLTMSDSTVRNFCTYQCVMSFQSQFGRKPLELDGESRTHLNNPVPTGLPKRIKPGQVPVSSNSQSNARQGAGGRGRPPKNAAKAAAPQTKNNNLVISSVTSLAPAITTRSGRGRPPKNSVDNVSMGLQPVVELEPLPSLMLGKGGRSREDLSMHSQTATRVETKTQIVTVPPIPKPVSNKSTMCMPAMVSKEVTCKPTTCTIGCQTDSYLEQKIVIPIPVPIYMPAPMQM